MQHNITVWSQGNYCVHKTDPFFYENLYFLTLQFLYGKMENISYIFLYAVLQIILIACSFYFFLFSLISDLT